MNETSLPPRDQHRFRFLLLTAVLAAGGLLYANFKPDLEQNFRGWLTVATIAGALLLVVLWYLLLSGYNVRARVVTAVMLVAAWFGLRAVLRVDGSIDGRGLPRVVWKWTPPRDARLQRPFALPAPPQDLPAPPGGADVPQFFGPNRDGIVRGAHLARDWNASPPKLLWRQPIGVGWSAFSVVDGRAFTQEQRGGEELVTCYELLTGRLLWSHVNAVRFSQWQGGDGPRATPTFHDGKIFAMGATGILDCLDAITGKPVWSHDVLAENGLPNILWGISDSPLVFDDRVVVTGGDVAGPTMLAFQRETGAPLWKTGMAQASYSSPVLGTLVGIPIIVTLNAASFSIANASTGAMLLEQPWKDNKWPKASQPVLLEGDRLFITAGYGYGCEMFQVKAAPGGTLAAVSQWSNLKLKAQFNSVALRDGFFYGLDDGSLACVDAGTGERKWKGGRFGSGQSLVVDDLILIQAEPGPVVLAEANPAGFHELGRFNALSSKTWNHPVLAGRYLLVRNDREAACYELPVNVAGR